jgi:hypothetical protein
MGNYGPAAGSPVINAGTSAAVSGVTPPTTDFYGNTRVAPNDIGAVEFFASTSGNPAGAATLSTLSPAYGVRNSTVTVTLYGMGLTGSTAVTVSGAGVTASGLTVVNDTTLRANFAIAATAAIGARNVTVTTPTGLTNPVTFTVETPTLSFMVPTQGARGNIVNVTLYGSGLTGVSAVTVAGTGVTATSVSALNDTTVQATFNITTTATLGNHNVTVTSVSGTSNALPFAVVAPATPTLNAISPARGVRSNVVAVKLTGSLLNGATAITVSPATGITVGPITQVSANEVDTTFTIASTAPLGARNVSITTPGGVSNFVTFQVLAPTLSSVSPNLSLRGITNLPLTFSGIGLTGATAFTATPATGFTLSGLTVVNDTTVTANLTITSAAATGVHTISITTPDGATNTVPFTVLTSTLTAITPVSGVRGGPVVPVTLTGAGLTGSTAVNISGGNVNVSGPTVVNDTTVTANFTILAAAARSIRTVSLTTPSGTTNTVPFTVGPFVGGIAPTSATRGAAPVMVNVVLSGAGLTGATGLIGIPATGVTVSGFTVGSDNTVSATLTIAPTAAAATLQIGVAIPSGNSNTVAFTIN